MKYKPGYPKEPCDGVGRRAPAHHQAMEAVVASARLALELREHVNGLTGLGRPPIAPHRPGFDQTAWRFLATYLIEERRLIEFLLGPVVHKPKEGPHRYAHPDAICLDCFTPPHRRWRFPDQKARFELDARADRINVRLAHFSWTLAEPDSRADHGIWNTEYLDLVLAGLNQFADHLEGLGSNLLAGALKHPMISTESPD